MEKCAACQSKSNQVRLTTIDFGGIFTLENMIMGKGRCQLIEAMIIDPLILAQSPNQSLCQSETGGNVEMLANVGSFCGRQQGKSKCKSFLRT